MESTIDCNHWSAAPKKYLKTDDFAVTVVVAVVVAAAVAAVAAVAAALSIIKNAGRS